VILEHCDRRQRTASDTAEWLLLAGCGCMRTSAGRRFTANSSF